MKTFFPTGGYSAQPQFNTVVVRAREHWRKGLSAFCIVAALMAGAHQAKASDPVGIYAYIDKVVLEPSDKAPERAQVWGGFSLAEGPGDNYAPPKPGYMYFEIKPGDETTARNEWNDFKSLAGTGQLVAFGNRHRPKGTVRTADAKVEKPDPHPIGFGLIKINDATKGVRNTDYPPIKQLHALREKQKGSSAAATKKAAQ